MKRTLMAGVALVAMGAGVAFASTTGTWCGPWERDTVYNAATGPDWSKQGDTVTLGTWPQTGSNLQALVWKGKFGWIAGYDTPGVFAAEGGTSAWDLVNSKAISQTVKTPTAWTGWIGGQQTTLAADKCFLPTWKWGALGAYTICHDDIGDMDVPTLIQPQIDVENAYPQVHVTWGAIACAANGVSTGGQSKDQEWDLLRTLARRGDEIASHSWNHHSAADQWLWFNQGDTIKLADVGSVTMKLTGLIVAPITITKGTPNSQATASNALVTVTYHTGWDGLPSDDLDTLAKFPRTITPAADVTPVTLPASGYTVYVKYTTVDSVNGANVGQVAAVDPMWSDAADGTTLGLKVFCVPGWFNRDQAQQDSNTTIAKKFIDDSVYKAIQGDAVKYPGGLGQYFAPHKLCEFYIYPYDAYSEKTHQALSNAQFLSARGGGKSGKPTFCDFYHPYRLDYDAFYLCNGDTTALFGGTGLKANPNQLLSLDGMLTDIIKAHGYMIRELHAVLDVGSSWMDVNDETKGGYWGGIPKDLYTHHLQELTSLINNDSLVVYTATEAVKYRATGNNCTAATLTKTDSKHYHLSVTATPLADPRYIDEISVICKFDAPHDSLNAIYTTPDATWGAHPYQLPRKLPGDGSAWSIQLNPFVAGGIDIVLDTTWTGPVVGIKKGDLALANVEAMKHVEFRNGIVKATVPTGKYQISMVDLAGRQVGKAVYGTAASTGLITANMNVASLAKGFYVLNLKTTKGVVNTRVLISK